MENEKQEKQEKTYTIDANLRRKGLMNSALLAVQFGMIAFASFKAGSSVFAAIGVFATILTINDALSFYYANKEK